MNWFKQKFCNHEYHVIRMVYLPPINRSFQYNRLDTNVLMTLMYGKTTLVNKCCKCGKTYTEECIGKVE